MSGQAVVEVGARERKALSWLLCRSGTDRSFCQTPTQVYVVPRSMPTATSFVRDHVDGVASVGGARVEMGGLRLRRSSSFVFSQKPKISEKITKSHDTDQDVGCAQKRSARGFVAREE